MRGSVHKYVTEQCDRDNAESGKKAERENFGVI